MKTKIRNSICGLSRKEQLPRTQALWNMFGRLAVVALAMLIVNFGSTPAQAASTIVVPRDFPTIQAAVDAVAPGDTIRVRSGTYTEQVVIAKDLTLVGEGVGQTVVQAPPVLIPFAFIVFNHAPAVAVVRVTDGADVTISGLTVTGPIPCGVTAAGMIVVKAATLELSNSHITRIRPEGSTCSGFSLGRGVGVGLPPTVQIDDQLGSTGHAIIADVTVDLYQDVGMSITAPLGGAPSTATITNNSITGGASSFRPVSQIGIVLTGAIIAQVKENTVSGNVCTRPSCGQDPIFQVQSIGIYTETAAEILENHTSENDVGIYQIFSENPSTIRENTLENNTFFGIVIQDGDGATDENTIKGGEVGIAVVAGSQDTVGVLREDKITRTSVATVQEIECCGFQATAIVEDD
jgi:parallel beta-helix repeat protein